MLGNANSLITFAADSSYEPKMCAPLTVLQELRWRSCFGVLKANILFLYEKEQDDKPPIMVILIEDCFVQLGDDNSIGMEFTFEIMSKTTGRTYTFATENVKTLERWVTVLSSTSMEYIRITKQSFQEQIEQKEAKGENKVESKS